MKASKVWTREREGDVVSECAARAGAAFRLRDLVAAF